VNVQEQFLNPSADEPIYQLQGEMRARRGESQEKWRTFETERDKAAKSNMLQDDAVATRLEELREDYVKSDTAYRALEDRWQTETLKASSIPADSPGEAEKAWSRATFRRLYESKALDATSGGTVPPPYYDPQLRTLPYATLFVRSVLPVIAASEGDRISFLRQTVRTNNAAVVGVGSAKPGSVFSVERVEQAFSVIAHLTEAVDRMLLSDYAGLQQFLDQELRLGVLIAEEREILTGSGVFPHLPGILNAGIGTQAKGSDSVSDALLKGLNKVRTLGLVEPDAIVMTSANYETAVLEKASTAGTYLHGSPDADTTPTLWGKKVIISPVLTAGTALVGSFATGAAIYDREQPRVDFTDGGELFTKNQLLFRGEERVTLAVFRPAAFATVTGL
jgi:HK97 family phage major capsid protein